MSAKPMTEEQRIAEKKAKAKKRLKGKHKTKTPVASLNSNQRKQLKALGYID